MKTGNTEEAPIFERAHDKRMGIRAQTFPDFLDRQGLMLFNRGTERSGIALEGF